VADDGALPIVLYNVPGRTGCDMLPETVADLAGHARIIGVKEARADAERIDALLTLRSNGFSVLSGDDPTACRAMLAGADGVVSVASNVLPGAFRRLCDHARAGQQAEAQSLDARMHAAYEFLGAEPNPIPVKALLARLGTGHGVRLPLLPLSSEHAVAASSIAADILAIEQSIRDMLAA
jgi:4-hydroxy-tetrahydrodipicolinate synthase